MIFLESAPAGAQIILPSGFVILGAAEGPLPIIVVTIPAQTVIAETTLAQPPGSVLNPTAGSS